MTQHIPRLPWSDLASTAPSLPGGADAQLSTLREVMRAFAGEAPSGPVGDPESAERIQKQIAPLELTARGDHGIQLTDLGRQWLQDPNRDDLFRIMHARVAYFGEMLARINEAPARVEDLHAHATTEFLMSWTSLDQIRRRLAWLHSMGLVEDGPDRFHRITADGHSALAGIELQTPEGLRAVLSEAHADVTLPPAPPALATALERARSEKRSLSWSYLTKDPVGALTALARLASAGTTKEEAVSVVSAEYEISASSAKSFVDAAGALGIYEFVGKYEIRTTPLGREWIESASPLNLVRLLHVRFLGIGELLVQLDDQPRSVGEIHSRQFAASSDAPRQGRTAGILRYLSGAGAVAAIGYARYVLTGLGRALIRELPIAEVTMVTTGDEDTSVPVALDAPRVEQLIAELETASRDSANPDRFEKACAEAFVALGVESKHLGGPGRTDVIVTVKSGLTLVARAIVDAKSASGQLNEGSVNFAALKEHAAKHGATLMAVIAPRFDGSGRLSDWAKPNGVVLLSVADLAGLLRAHETHPFSARDVAELLTVDGRDDVEARHSQAMEQLSLITGVLRELAAEASQDNPEPIAARDIRRVMSRAGSVTTDDEVSHVLRFLALPEVAAVQNEPGGRYTLPSSPSIAAKRLRAIARAIEASSFGA
ncbi:MAG: hypothetical protein J0I33_12970 [Microbacterium ginsengisoli]|uniref:hypothetical protein n=2 Tax=Microbacteriaceae TaxID=85023 RepID=UPI000ABF1D90|nr:MULTISPECIES: hypothetical protein [unclassified Microbacterium]MBN9199539.1 hypothetical protein [Microbacterium ginsengisoli]